MPKTAINQLHLEQFWYWVNERHKIYHKRFVLGRKPPWTKDDVLRDFHFTNVYRKLDRGTLYLTNVILPAIEKPKDKLFNIFIYRYFNHIPTYEFLTIEQSPLQYMPLGTWNWKVRAKQLKNWKNRGNQVFTSAFTVTGNRFGGFSDKIDNVCWLIDWIQTYLKSTEHSDLWWRPIWDAPDMETAFRYIRGIKGFGAFLAYEVVVDVNYANGRWHENDFVNAGPGCKRGLNHIFPEARGKQYEALIHWLLRKQYKYLPPKHFERGEELTLRDIEHSLCEYSKYVKRQAGIRTGRARKFVGPNKNPLP